MIKQCLFNYFFIGRLREICKLLFNVQYPCIKQNLLFSALPMSFRSCDGKRILVAFAADRVLGQRSRLREIKGLHPMSLIHEAAQFQQNIAV